jgi:hypothetical protein
MHLMVMEALSLSDRINFFVCVFSMEVLKNPLLCNLPELSKHGSGGTVFAILLLSMYALMKE